MGGNVMDMHTIETFIQVAELQSFTKAAAALGYAQSTVTMQVRALEQELGYPLFDRIGKRISLTAPGQKFLVHAYEITHILEQAGALNKEAGGTLRVGVLESLLFGKLTARLPAFKAQHPQTKLQIKMGQAAELLQLAKQNQLDLVYLSADLNTDPDLICLYQQPENMIFVCGAAHPLATADTVSASELFAEEFIVTERSGICFGRLRKLAAANGVLLRDSVEVDSTAVIATLLQTGMGVAFLPAYAITDQLADGRLIRLNVQTEPEAYFSQILCHKDRWLSPVMQDFVALCADT